MRPRGALIGGQIASTAKAAPATSRRAGGRLEAPSTTALHPPKWLFGFLIIEISCQIALLSTTLAAGRVFIRSAAFAASLAGIFLLRGNRAAHPSRQLAVIALLIVGVSTLHPDSSGFVVSFATFLLYLAILGPLFWVPRIRIDVSTVRKLVFAFWTLQAASAAAGALQLYFPGRFQPPTATVLTDLNIEALQITLANGARVSRPMGLTDTPGGAGIGAAYCVILGTGLLLDRPRLWLRGVIIGAMCVACFTLYLCQVRSMLVMVVISLLAMAAPMLLQARLGRLATFALPLVATAVVAFVMATAIGGEDAMKRLSTLVAADPTTVYYSNRGMFLQHTFTDLLPDYPLGAGVGRWGMMRTYFGNAYDSVSRPIWVEIQWTGWLLDGGLPLMLVEAGCMLMAIREAMRLALRQDVAGRELAKFASMIGGYSVGALALTFNSCPFATTMGLDFWLLNATLYAASSQLAS